MAGPWFTVQTGDDDWQELAHIWISNGADDCQGTVEIKIELQQAEDAPETFAARQLQPKLTSLVD